MKKTLHTLVFCMSILLIACTSMSTETTSNVTKPSVVKMDDEISAKIQLLFEKYIQNEWDIMDLYAEDVVCKINNLEITGRDNLMEGFKMHHALLYKDIMIENNRIQTEYWNNGEIWSRAWFTWTGQGQTTGTNYSNRGHFDYKWQDGQIVELLGYWSEDIQNLETSALTEVSGKSE